MLAHVAVPTESRHAILRRDLYSAAARERTNTAEFLALIGEYDALRLFVEDGHSSMHSFCMSELLLCEESAYKRIQAARAARKFPQLLSAFAEGRLHLSAVFLLGPHLTPENVDEVVAAATHLSIRALRGLIAQRFVAPRPELELTPRGDVDGKEPGPAARPAGVLETFPVGGENRAYESLDSPRIGPLCRIDVHCVVDQEKLEHARALLSHSVPDGDLGKIFDRALDAVIRETEKRKFGAAIQPREQVPRRAPAGARGIPADVKRAVWMRDAGQCTFRGSGGRSCAERRFLEFDHIRPVALGGEGGVENLRLRCRTHNQYEAERVFGTEFMVGRREASRRTRAGVQREREGFERVPATESARGERVRAVMTGLRGLGCGAEEARHAAERGVGAVNPDSPLEDCLRAALRSLARPRGTRRDETAGAATTAPGSVEDQPEAMAVSLAS